MNDKLLKQFEKITIVQHNRNLFRLLCGLELEVRRIDGSILDTHPKADKNTSDTQSKARVESNSRIEAPLHCCCDDINPSCFRIDEDIINKITESHLPQSYVCNGGLHKIVIPIIFKEKMIGLLFTGENTKFTFENNHKSTIMEILKRFVDYVSENELQMISLDLYTNEGMSRQRELLDRAVKYIRKNFHDNEMSLKDVSLNNGISYHYLSRIFKKELKTTFGQFRSKVRIDAAARMLRYRKLSVSQISYACGFDDPAYFCKVFKLNYGVSPLNYRNRTAGV